jgi:hypothetical protein
MTANSFDRLVIGREQNVLRVNFVREPEPPTPPFPGAGALRACVWVPQPEIPCSGLRAEVA